MKEISEYKPEQTYLSRCSSLWNSRTSVSQSCEANTYEEFKQMLDETPGFISAHWDGTPETEQRIKEETKATIRCIPLDNKLKMVRVY